MNAWESLNKVLNLILGFFSFLLVSDFRNNNVSFIRLWWSCCGSYRDWLQQTTSINTNINNVFFQEEGATCHTSRETITPGSCDLTPIGLSYNYGVVGRRRYQTNIQRTLKTLGHVICQKLIKTRIQGYCHHNPPPIIVFNLKLACAITLSIKNDVQRHLWSNISNFVEKMGMLTLGGSIPTDHKRKPEGSSTLRSRDLTIHRRSGRWIGKFETPECAKLDEVDEDI